MSSLLLLGWTTSCGAARSPESPSTHPKASEARVAPGVAALSAAEQLFDKSRYPEASEAYLRLIEQSQGELRARARLGLGEVYLLTGKGDEALEQARLIESERPSGSPAILEASRVLQAEVLARRGELEQAVSKLQASGQGKGSAQARLLLGELLIEQGKREAAKAPLMSLVQDYNDDSINAQDGLGLALVGRAAHLLGSAQDANDAFNQAERVAPKLARLSLYRAALFLDKYDPGHAEEVLSELLERAPNHPEANMWMAQVRLDQAYDFDEAERLARKALSADPTLGRAHAVLAGIALRDGELALAEARGADGLRHNPRDLELLSLLATARYLADDAPGFEAAKARVLALNAEYARLYSIIGDFAEWEHRYEEIVGLMQEALKLDPEHAKARAQLGINLIRLGREGPGVTALRHAFALDPFNVRVYNTLDLYEKEIPKHYESVETRLFRFRYPRVERAMLERYVPELLTLAQAKFEKAYGMRPKLPTGVELYATRQAFSVRTIGLPETAISGVCFGRTLAALALSQEKYNLPMTLWHELAHVFHIQLSNSRVPRWFTEGLAEYETLTERPEWSREHDADLFEALRTGTLPRLSSMTRAFTRGDDLQDVATAYYASSVALEFLAERFGTAAFPRMLKAWAEGADTLRVFQEVLGVSAEALDLQFRAYVEQRLAHYKDQFVPVRRTGAPAKALELARSSPDVPEHLARAVLVLLRQNRGQAAEQLLFASLEQHPKDPNLRFLKARLLLERKQSQPLLELLVGLIAEGFDGYAAQALLADAHRLERDWEKALLALERAHEWDPREVEALRAIALLTAQLGRADAEQVALEKLARLDEHNAAVYERLLERYLLVGDIEAGVSLGPSAIYADLSNGKNHSLYGELLLKAGRTEQALFELESATLAPGPPEQVASAHERLAALLASRGKGKAAEEHRAAAKALRERQ